jgi:hypothetical protein
MQPFNFNSFADTDEYCRNLIQQGEGARVEFKTSFQKEVIASLVANLQGGIVGVTDKFLLDGVL